MGRILGLSGGIGSGKSTVTRLLAELGAETIDADAIVHELQGPGTPLLAEMAAVFGEHILDASGALDRKALGEVVFSDADARAHLGRLVHPPVIAEMMRRAAASLARRDPLTVLDIPLLFEGRKTGTGSGALMKFDATVAIWVPVELQVERTVVRDQCTPEEARRRVAAQLPIDEKRAMADHVIDNSGPLEETARQVHALFHELTSEPPTS